MFWRDSKWWALPLGTWNFWISIGGTCWVAMWHLWTDWQFDQRLWACQKQDTGFSCSMKPWQKCREKSYENWDLLCSEKIQLGFTLLLARILLPGMIDYSNVLTSYFLVPCLEVRFYPRLLRNLTSYFLLPGWYAYSCVPRKYVNSTW